MIGDECVIDWQYNVYNEEVGLLSIKGSQTSLYFIFIVLGYLFVCFLLTESFSHTDTLKSLFYKHLLLYNNKWTMNSNWRLNGTIFNTRSCQIHIIIFFF